jgi:hypothetical protein
VTGGGAIALALVFGFAGCAKLIRPAPFRAALDRLAPTAAVPLLAWAVPLLELLVAILLLAGGGLAVVGSAGALLLLLVFSVALAMGRRTGRAGGCGCFGRADHDGAELVRNALLGAAAAVLVSRAAGVPLGGPGEGAAAALVVGGMAVGLLRATPRQGQVDTTGEGISRRRLLGKAATVAGALAAAPLLEPGIAAARRHLPCGGPCDARPPNVCYSPWKTQQAMALQFAPTLDAPIIPGTDIPEDTIICVQSERNHGCGARSLRLIFLPNSQIYSFGYRKVGGKRYGGFFRLDHTQPGHPADGPCCGPTPERLDYQCDDVTGRKTLKGIKKKFGCRRRCREGRRQANIGGPFHSPEHKRLTVKECNTTLRHAPHSTAFAWLRQGDVVTARCQAHDDFVCVQVVSSAWVRPGTTGWVAGEAFRKTSPGPCP